MRASHTSIITLFFTNNKLNFCRFSRMIDQEILKNAMDIEKGSSDIEKAMRQVSTVFILLLFSPHRYFSAITDYMQQLRSALGELRDDIE